MNANPFKISSSPSTVLSMETYSGIYGIGAKTIDNVPFRVAMITADALKDVYHETNAADLYLINAANQILKSGYVVEDCNLDGVTNSIDLNTGFIANDYLYFSTVPY